MCRSIDFVTQLTDPLPAIEGGEPERREGGEAASGSSGVEPLEDGPEQAAHAGLDDERHLLPVIRRSACPSAPRVHRPCVIKPEIGALLTWPARHHGGCGSC